MDKKKDKQERIDRLEKLIGKKIEERYDLDLEIAILSDELSELRGIR